MGADTKIEWATHTFSPWWGCTRVSAACRFCYAEKDAARYGHNVWGANAPRRALGDKHWSEPAKWDRAAAAAGERHRVFSGSMCDVFEDVDAAMVNHLHERLPDRTITLERDRLFTLIESTPHLDWLLLTKRPENVLRMVPPAWLSAWPTNVWCGTTVEDQAAADTRIPELLRIPAPIRFLSCEPLLERVDVAEWLHDSDCVIATEHVCSCTAPHELRVDWIITGGESGPNARPSHPDWFRHLRDQCKAADTAFFFKQWGEWLPLDGHRDRLDLPSANRRWERVGGELAAGGSVVVRVGKKDAGRTLDDVIHSTIPTTKEPTHR